MGALERRIEALADAAELPRLFPWLRAEGAALATFAERVARDLGEGEVPPEVVGAGIALLDADERERIVSAVTVDLAEDWARITAAVGADAAEVALLDGAVCVAVESRSLPARHLLRVVETGDELDGRPLEALALAIPGARLWSIEDVVDAGAAAADRPSDGFLDAAERIAHQVWTDWQEDRLREQSAVIARHLPLDGLPRASALFAEACAAVEQDAEAALEVGALMLLNYVVLMVARETRLRSAPARV